MGQSHSQSQTHISVLPNEVVVSILQHLPPQDLKSAVLVCKSLREMGEKPIFWTWAVVKVTTKDDLQKFKRPRLQMLQEIDVTQGSHGGATGAQSNWIKEEGLADLFEIIGEIPTVKRIRGLEFCKGIEDIETDLVISVLNSLEELQLCYGLAEEDGEEDEKEKEDKDEEEMQMKLSTGQLELLFTALAEKTNLKFLQVSGQDMIKDMDEIDESGEMDESSRVDESGELHNSDEVDESGESDENGELDPIYQMGPMDEMDDMDQVSPELFAAAVSNVEEVLLKEHFKEDITSKQFEALFTTMAAEDRPVRKLTCMSFYIDPMGEVAPELLDKAVNRLEEFTTVNTGSVEQWTAILRGLVEGDSRLKKLMVKDMDPKVVQNLDQNLVGRAKEKIGEFYTTHPFYL